MTTDESSTGPALTSQLADGSLAGQWTLDPSGSSVALRTKSMWGLAPVKGTFEKVSGDAVITPAGEVSGTLRVDAASINTKIGKRDEHLRSADLLESDKYPNITFTAQELKSAEHGATLTGALEIRDQTRPLSFPVTISAPAQGQIQLDAELVIDRSDFGMNWKQMGARTVNTLTIRALFTRQ